MIIAFSGYRYFNNYEYFLDVMLNFKLKEIPELTVHVGDATGLDSLVVRYCEENNISCIIFKANWKLHRHSAGPKRNEKMIVDCDLLIAFPSICSKGTLHAISYANRLDKEVKIFKID